MTIHHHMTCREIITKAVCGKGRKFALVSHTVTPPCSPTSILGAWIINHQYEAIRSGDHVEVAGTYDINIWYSHDHNSKTDVAKEMMSYVETIPLTYIDQKHKSITSEVVAESTQAPHCVEANIAMNGKHVVVRVEREFEVQMIAETKVCILVCQGNCNEEDDKYVNYDDNHASDYEELDDVMLENEYSS